MKSFSMLEVKQNGAILSITLHRPEQLNALSHELLQELQTCLITAKQDNTIKALLLTGAGEKARGYKGPAR